MNDDHKEGVSVKDIENFTRKYRFEVFFCLAFLLAFFFTFIMYRPWCSVLAMSIGGILGVLLATKVSAMSRSIFEFFQKQENTTQLVLGIVLLIIAIFLSPLIFLLLGLHGGKDMFRRASEFSGK